MSATLTFDESAAEFILSSFGKGVDDEGYVVDEDGNRETVDGKPIQTEHFAGLEKGSVIVLDDDFNTLVDHVKRRREE